MADAAHAARIRTDAEPDVVRAEACGRCGQHDPCENEQNHSSHRARTDNERQHDRDRSYDEGSDTAIERSHIADHRVPPRLEDFRLTHRVAMHVAPNCWFSVRT